MVKGGDLARLMAKLKDVDFSYATAKSRQSTLAPNWRKLEDRRIEDVQWYIAEYLDRHCDDEVQAELRRMADKIDPMVGIALALVRTRAGVKADHARLAKALTHERNRADHLEMKLSELRQMIEK